MTTKLEIYNKALGHLGSTRLHPSQGLSENRSDRRALDARWSGVCEEMLELGIWRFALRTYQADADPDIEPAFGLQYAYVLPDDFKGLHKIALDEKLSQEDRSFEREGDRIYSDHSTLYFTIVSNGAAYGMNVGLWTELYAEAHGLLLANKTAVEITKDQNLETKLLRKFEGIFLPRAKRKDAVDTRVLSKPQGSWTIARFTRSGATNRRAE